MKNFGFLTLKRKFSMFSTVRTPLTGQNILQKVYKQDETTLRRELLTPAEALLPQGGWCRLYM